MRRLLASSCLILTVALAATGRGDDLDTVATRIKADLTASAPSTSTDPRTHARRACSRLTSTTGGACAEAIAGAIAASAATSATHEARRLRLRGVSVGVQGVTVAAP